MKKSTTLIIALISTSVFSQQHKRELYDSLKVYTYNAVFINEVGDTSSNETILFKPQGKIWKIDEQQDVVKTIYSSNDSVLAQFKNPKDKKKEHTKIRKTIESTSGLIETDSLIWLHPFRGNQYAYTEVAPFPEVKISKLQVGKCWNGGELSIQFGWGGLKGKVIDNYQVIGNSQISWNNKELRDCWEIKATGIHNKLGESTVNYIFQKEVGFLTMDYHFYNGYRIVFSLVEIGG